MRKTDTIMMISFIFTPCPLCGIVILFIFIIAGIKHGFKNMAKDAEAYNKKHGKQEGKKCETEMVDEGMIHLPNEKYGKKVYGTDILYDESECPFLS